MRVSAARATPGVGHAVTFHAVTFHAVTLHDSLPERPVEPPNDLVEPPVGRLVAGFGDVLERSAAQLLDPARPGFFGMEVADPPVNAVELPLHQDGIHLGRLELGQKRFNLGDRARIAGFEPAQGSLDARLTGGVEIGASDPSRLDARERGLES